MDNIFGIFISVFYIVIIFIIANIIKNKVIESNLKKHFIRGLTLKLIGSISIFIVYFYIYESGDTYYYYKRAEYIKFIFSENFNLGLKLLFKNPQIYDPQTYGIFMGLRAWDSSSFLIVKLATFFSFFSFGNYLPIAFGFSLLSYFGIWKLYKTLVTFYPKNINGLSISFLYLPSLFFWGSGLLKDTITIGFLCLFTSYFIDFIFYKKFSISRVILSIISIYIIGVIKSYILLALFPALLLLLFFNFRNKIPNKFIKNFSTPLFLVVIFVSSLASLNLFSSIFTKFNIDNIEKKATDMQRWHTYKVNVLQGGDGSSYNLGDVDFSPVGILKKIPAAVNVAIFRPYLWEVSNPLMLFSAFESFFIFLYTLKLIFYSLKKPRILLQNLNNNSVIIFMLVFSLIFGFSVGFTSYNFGALSRYRIPLLPFYLSSVLIIIDKLKNTENSTIK